MILQRIYDKNQPIEVQIDIVGQPIKKPYFRLSHDFESEPVGRKSSFFDDIGLVLDPVQFLQFESDLMHGHDDQEYVLKVIHLSRTEFYALPEFKGF